MVVSDLFPQEMCLLTFVAAEIKVWLCRKEKVKLLHSVTLISLQKMISALINTVFIHLSFLVSATWNKSVKRRIKKVLIMFSTSCRNLFMQAILQKGFKNQVWRGRGKKHLFFCFSFCKHLRLVYKLTGLSWAWQPRSLIRICLCSKAPDCDTTQKTKAKQKAADQMLMLVAFVTSPDEGAGKQLNDALFFSHLTIN